MKTGYVNALASLADQRVIMSGMHTTSSGRAPTRGATTLWDTFTEILGLNIPPIYVGDFPCLAIADAGKELPESYMVRRLPMTNGYLYFQTPLEIRLDHPVIGEHTELVRAVLFEHQDKIPALGQRRESGLGDEPGVVLYILTECAEEDGSGVYPKEAISLLIAWQYGQAISEVLLGSRTPFLNMVEILSQVAALWEFMIQKIVTVIPTRAPRPYVRQMKRAGILEVPDIQVITLRAHEQQVYAASEASGVEWTHRWIVRGHWRDQWYPRMQLHLPKWISPYVKGPDGTPLIGGAKIFAVER